MSVTPSHRICQGVTDSPPPPLAGALAAWLFHEGRDVRVVDPRGEAPDWSGEGTLWVHLEAANWARISPQIPAGEGDIRFFGPEAEQGAAEHPEATIIRGDPEGSGIDPALLPITTYAGFGTQPGGLFRILAGRFGQPRPLPSLMREVVYLVETFGAGHLLFDDEDLSHYAELINSFADELTHLPWKLTWEGRAAGLRVRDARDFQNRRL